MPKRISQETIFELAKARAPYRILLHPGMIQQAERNFLYHYIQNTWDSNTDILDAGIFLGASSRIFGEALQARGASRKCIHSYEFGVFNPYNAKHASELMGQKFESGSEFGDVIHDLLYHQRHLIHLNLGDISQKTYSGYPISFAFIDIMKNYNTMAHVMETFFPHFTEGTILYHQDYFHPRHPWITYSMARFSDAFEYLGRPDPDKGALNAAIFRVKDPAAIPREIAPLDSLSREEILETIDQGIANHKSPVEKLNVIGSKAVAEAAFSGDESRADQEFRAQLQRHGIDNYLQDASQQHHVQRIQRMIAAGAAGNVAW